MARLYVFAEGRTEQTFADTALKPHLAHFAVYMHNPVLIAHSRRKGVVHRGGGRRYLPMKNDIQRLIKQDSDSDAFFTTMVDLYALHADFPGRDEAEGLRSDPQKRVLALEAAWADDIQDSRFVPFLQLHEYEAYLFTDVSQFELFYPSQPTGIANLQRIAASVSTPELIDDGQQTAPSKRIITEFPDYEGAKATIGPQVGELIGLGAIRAKCPHFDRWLTKLERLGKRN
jgi:hypothetical protein